MDFDGFDWNAGNRSKCGQHGVPLGEIENLFRSVPLVGPDTAHSLDEQRFRAIGRTAARRGLFVVFTFRRNGENLLIRPISARYMHAKEIKAYEEAIS